MRPLVLTLAFWTPFFKIHNTSKKVSYCDFVLAEQNSIGTEFKVVIGSQGSQDDLNSFARFVQVECQLVSQHLFVCSYSFEDDGKCRSNFIAKEFVLWEQSGFVLVSYIYKTVIEKILRRFFC